MAFHDVELTGSLRYTSVFGAGFSTIVNETASGHEFRVARQSQGRHRFRLVRNLETQAEAASLKDFALARRGALHSFKIKDWSDFTTAADGISAPTNLDCVIGVGDGTTTTFQLRKVYDPDGPAPYVRPIHLPVSGTVVASVGGAGTTSFTVSADGRIVFNTAPDPANVIRAGCEFRVPVRFGIDFDRWAQLQADDYRLWSMPNMDCVEVLGEVENPERWSHGGLTNWGTRNTDIALALNNGRVQVLTCSGALSMFLPPPSRLPGGHVFTVICNASSSANVQIRDDSGGTVGTSFGSGGAVRDVYLARDATTSTWVVT